MPWWCEEAAAAAAARATRLRVTSSIATTKEVRVSSA
jgi:hypothetical protein